MIPKYFQRISFLLVGILMFSLPVSIFAQSKTDKLLRKANARFNTENFVAAEDLYKSVVANDPNNYQATYRLGITNDYLEDYEEALRYYLKAAEIAPERNDTVHLYIGLTYKKLNNYRKAKESFLAFQSKHETEDEYFRRAQLEIEGCDLAVATAGKRPRHTVSPLSINSNALDAFPSFLDQRQEDAFVVFTSHRKSKGRRNKPYQGLGQPAFSDLFISVMENDSVYGAPDNLGKPVNTKMNDGTSTFTPDGLTMYYTICNDKKNRYGCSIYESRYDPIIKKWGRPELVPGIAGQREIVVNDRGKTKRVPTDDRQPSLSSDGKTMYFASDRGGGNGGFDLYFVRRQGRGWTTPVNLGTTINTAFDELTPYINQADNVLYFASNGHGGFGGFDLYESAKSGEAFGTPKNMRAPLNSSYDEISGMWMDDDSLVLFSSNRPGGLGSYDIYRAVKNFIDPNKLNISVQGLVRDKKTKQPIPFATAILYEYVGANTILPLDTFNTDQTARYNFRLKRNKNYKILGNAPEYLANEEDVTTMGIEDDTDIEQNIDIELEPIVLGFPIVLQNIYYDFDEYYIRPDALADLKNLVKILNQNENITIELGSHTDSNGTIKYNDVLSDNRAKAVIKFLVDNGISPSRLSWYGYGEGKPLIFPELTDEDEQANRRTEFRILSIDFDNLVPN